VQESAWHYLKQRFLIISSLQAARAFEVSSEQAGRPVSSYVLVVYLLSLAASVSIWFIALRTPLWLDETVSFWQIRGGFGQLWSRAFLFFPAYNFILLVSTKLLGTSEVALRVPSVLAMLAAVYLLYRTGRHFLGQELGLLAAVLFCSNPIVIFAAIDARPYAFSLLAINASIYCLGQLRTTGSYRVAAAFGVTAALIVWFQFLYGVILPALLIGFFLVKTGDHHQRLWRQLGIAMLSFVIAFLPIIPKVLQMMHSPGSHSFAEAGKPVDFIWTLAPGWQLLIFLGTGFLALLIAAWSTDRRGESRTGSPHFPEVALCLALALVPTLLLYEVSVRTSLHIFVQRYRLVGIPGVALAWSALVGTFQPRILRTVCCVAVVATVVQQYLMSPIARHHGSTWKYAIEAVEKNASIDGAPVLICSDLPEADFAPMPSHHAVMDNILFAPLSYYRLSVPVVPMPRTLTSDAIRLGSIFLQEQTKERGRFLAMGSMASYPTLQWLANTAADYEVRELGSFDEVKVLEFKPKK